MAQLQTKSHRDKAAAAANPFSADVASAFDMQKIAHLNDRTLEAARRFGAAMLDGMAGVNREMLHFMTARMQEDLRAVGALANSRDPAEFIRAEFRFLQTMIRNYAEGASRMLGASAAAGAAARAGTGAAAGETRRAYEGGAL